MPPVGEASILEYLGLVGIFWGLVVGGVVFEDVVAGEALMVLVE